jgi:hypothetical protein
MSDRQLCTRSATGRHDFASATKKDRTLGNTSPRTYVRKTKAIVRKKIGSVDNLSNKFDKVMRGEDNSYGIGGDCERYRR